jgi:outer membrane protein OmpU
MRKILLATTALVGFAVAGTAQAATAPLNVVTGGSVDFIAGAFHESRAAGATNSASGDFETIYSLNFGVTGKAANGMEYGGNLVLDNDVDPADSFAGRSNTVAVSKAIVFMSGGFGKVQLGDARGATDLTTGAPSVGGIRYLDFLDVTRFAKGFVVGMDGKDHSTNATYYTPKIGNDVHKVQAAVTYAPNFNQYGSTVQLVESSTYDNVIKGAIAYTGTFKSVAVKASTNIITGAASTAAAARDFVAWGVGAQVAYEGFTLGANYVDKGHYSMLAGDDKKQEMYGAGLKYEFDKYAVGFDYKGGEGYSHGLTSIAGTDYVKTFNTYNFGGAYTWAPGLTTNVTGVLFNEEVGAGAGTDNDGYVLLVSQKLAF